MNIDHIIGVFNNRDVRYLLIGGVNFLLRHKPVMTFDVDFWIEDSEENRRRCEGTLAELDAEWGQGEVDWGAVASKPSGWMDHQSVFCLTSPHGAIDVFRAVRGLSDWSMSFATSVSGETAAGTPYRGLCDEDMLRCQLCLEDSSRKLDRIRDLQRRIAADGHH